MKRLQAKLNGSWIDTDCVEDIGDVGFKVAGSLVKELQGVRMSNDIDTRTITIHSKTKAPELYKLLGFILDDLKPYTRDEEEDDGESVFISNWISQTRDLQKLLAEQHLVEETDL